MSIKHHIFDGLCYCDNCFSKEGKPAKPPPPPGSYEREVDTKLNELFGPHLTGERMQTEPELVEEVTHETAQLRQDLDVAEGKVLQLAKDNAELRSQLDQLVTKLKAVAMILRG